MNSLYLDSIRGFEGFTPRAQWDYAQHSNGYGTRALYPGEMIDRGEAERRFQSEIASARAIVERHAADADEGTKAALTSLTFNAGEKWTRDGLGDAVRRGDLEGVRSLFLEYNKAGGRLLEGLAARRVAEAQWIGNPQPGVGAAATSETMAAPSAAVAAWADRTVSERVSGVPARGHTTSAAGDRALSMPGGGGLEVTPASGGHAGPLLMSLRLHMALAASSRFEREEDKGEDRRPPSLMGSTRS